jgi:hypothetical protein
MIDGKRRISMNAGLCALALLVAILVFAEHRLRVPENDGSALGPLSRYALPASQRLSFEGRVVERLQASSYTYLLVERAGGAQSWVVTLASSVGAQSKVKRVKVLSIGYATRFTSKRLARTFDGLHFAVVRPA